jgi:hypothetical protein
VVQAHADLVGMAGFPRVLRTGRGSAGLPDRGDMILGWLTRIALLLCVAGVALYDSMSIGSTAMNLSDDGDYAARQASEVWQQTKNIQLAYNAAAAAATEQNAGNEVATKDFVVDDDGRVHLTISRNATTLVVFRFSATRKWAHVERHSTGLAVS